MAIAQNTSSSESKRIQDGSSADPNIVNLSSDQLKSKDGDQQRTVGLSSEQAANLLQQYGYNELPQEKANQFLKLLSYFWGPIPWMIEIAALLSAVVRHWADLGIILVLLIVNAVVGFWEEFQAGNAIDALQKKLAIRARVKRDGKWQILPARQLVPGDIIRLRIGDIVPADAKLLPGDPLEIDQSALTGESLPVSRKNGEVVYSGSIVQQGEGDARVNATGADTYFGKTAQLAGAPQSKSHFQKAVLKIGDYLIVLALLLVALILIVAIYRGDSIITTVQFALVLTVAAIPVAMPTVLSVTMAIGARILAKKEAIVSRLAAIEEMAGIDILCSDKTGTLTQNKLTLGKSFCVEQVGEDQLILAAALASRAEDQDPIDLAVLSGLKSDIDLEETYQVTHFQPFD
ncbi:MAG: HAD-IC family P-type ATPase, partial [Anaerolineales bacterium]